MAARTEHHMYVTTQQRADAIISEVYFESEMFASVRPDRWTWRSMYAGSAPMFSAPRHARLKRVTGTWICRALHFGGHIPGRTEAGGCLGEKKASECALNRRHKG